MMVGIDLNLSWKVKHKVLGAHFPVKIPYLLFEPVPVLEQELDAVYHPPVGPKLKLFHHLLECY
jgi:hypothetical protein